MAAAAEVPKSSSHVLHDLLLSGLAGTICRIPTHPLDTCKTVAFATEVGSASTLTAGRVIWSREGLRGFYRGIGIASVAAFPGNALYFVVYEWARDTTNAYQSAVGGWMLPKPLLHLGSGFFAEVVSCVVWVPVDVIKERLQAQGPAVEGRYRNSLHGFVTCLRQENVGGLYKGYCSTLASFGPFSAVYFASYEMIHQALHGCGFHPFTQGLVAAFVANTTAAIATNPLELIKTRLQIQQPILEIQGGGYGRTTVSGYQYSSFLDGLRQVLRDEGLRGLWRGAGARAIHTAPNAALTMGVYRWLQSAYPYSTAN